MNQETIQIIDGKHPEYIANMAIRQDKLDRFKRLQNRLIGGEPRTAAGANLLLQDREMREMLKDVTIFAYAFLRDEMGNPFELTNYQDMIASKRHDFSPDNPNRYVIFKAANQIGKSQLLAILGIFHLILGKNRNIVIVSKSLPQSQFVLATVRLMLNRSVFAESWREDVGETANTTVLTMQRDGGKIVNRIICAPAGEGLLGYPVHYLFLDEADFYEDAKTFFWKVALPRTNTTKGQIILFTNPNADIARSNSLLWELWNGDLFQQKFSFNFLDAPWNTKEEYDRVKRNSPSYIFASTHNGEFPEDAGSFFKMTELDRNFKKDWSNELPAADRPIWIAIDFGKTIDNTVLTIGMSKVIDEEIHLDVRYMKMFPLKTDYKVIVAELANIVDYYNNNYEGVAGIGFDATGVGKAIEEFINEKELAATPIIWSLKNKSRMYANFKVLMENDRIKMVFIEEAYKQLANLNFKTTPQGYLTQEASNKTHDDIPDSIAMLINVAVRPDYVTPGFTFIETEQGDEEMKNKKRIITEWSEDLDEEDIEDVLEAKRLNGERDNGFGRLDYEYF